MGRFARQAGEDQRATALELFYDLVFVFAITQVSHLLHAHLSWAGAGQAALVLLVVWWAWNYTTWVTNELDPESTAVRAVLIAIMLASLLLAVAIPEAFGSRAGLFAGAYVAIQVGRHLFLTFGAAEAGTVERVRAGRILIWFAVAGAFWIGGAVAGGAARTVLWLIALAIDYAAPLVTFRVPGLAPIPPSAWTVQTSHFAERFQLFVIIALGESIAQIGATTSELHLTVVRVLAFAAAFLVAAALWWLYFNYVARIAERRLELAGAGRTNMARDGYTYLHAVMIAGVVVSAVGDEIVIAEPGRLLGVAQVVAVVAGPALYLLAHTLFRLRMARSVSWKRLGGAIACAAAGALGAVLPALALEAALLGVLIAVIAAEHVAGARRRGRGEPSPLERLGAAE